MESWNQWGLVLTIFLAWWVLAVNFRNGGTKNVVRLSIFHGNINRATKVLGRFVYGNRFAGWKIIQHTKTRRPFWALSSLANGLWLASIHIWQHYSTQFGALSGSYWARGGVSLDLYKEPIIIFSSIFTDGSYVRVPVKDFKPNITICWNLKQLNSSKYVF